MNDLILVALLAFFLGVACGVLALAAFALWYDEHH